MKNKPFYLENIFNTLSKINGVGNIKAIELMAAIELGRRVYLEDNYKELVYLTNPESIYNYFHNLFKQTFSTFIEQSSTKRVRLL